MTREVCYPQPGDVLEKKCTREVLKRERCEGISAETGQPLCKRLDDDLSEEESELKKLLVQFMRFEGTYVRPDIVHVIKRLSFRSYHGACLISSSSSADVPCDEVSTGGIAAFYIEM